MSKPVIPAAGAFVSALAQFEQKRAPGRFGVPQRGQVTGALGARGAAQLEQKRAVSRFWVKPQLGQVCIAATPELGGHILRLGESGD